MLTLTIHRGTHQIGGCVTEIATDTSRIFIDFGSKLPGADGEQPKENLTVPGLTDNTLPCNGAFFTHTHGDHIGNIDRIADNIPLYMGEASKEIGKVINERLQQAYLYHPSDFSDRSDTLAALARARVFHSGERLDAGDITITPIRVDHSAFDAYMFLIEAEGLRILHTGDFRDHGYMGKQLEESLGKLGEPVDWLICEGTMLSRSSKGVMTEDELEGVARKIMKGHRHIFVFCSSTNIDRIRAFYRAKPHRMPAVCDKYQSDILNVIKRFDPTENNSYNFKYVIPYPEKEYQNNPKLLDWMDERGFLMFVRNKNFFQEYMEQYRGDCLVIYSMWEGYLNGATKNKKIVDFLEGYPYQCLHTSGHATADAIRKVYDIVRPRRGVVPIHTEAPEKFCDILPADAKIERLDDKDTICLN